MRRLTTDFLVVDPVKSAMMCNTTHWQRNTSETHKFKKQNKNLKQKNDQQTKKQKFKKRKKKYNFFYE